MSEDGTVGGFWCPGCKEFNACNCETCSKSESKHKRISWTEDGETLICGYCGITFSPDAALDMEYKMSQIKKKPMSDRTEYFQKERTRIISEMLDNPDETGIYDTTKCFQELDKLNEGIVRQACIEFGAEYAYRKANPEGKMDVPSIAYEDATRAYDRMINPPKERPDLAVNQVWEHIADGFKVVIKKSNIKEIKYVLDNYEFVCATPHRDGDYSYICGFDYCKCIQ